MSYQFIKYTETDGVARITLNRPDVLNSIHRAMSGELHDALDRASGDSIRSVYLTGAGRAFCAGQDLEEVSPDGPPVDFGDHVRTVYAPLILAIRALEKPVVCGVNGVAAGAGANLALACDIVIAVETTYFLQAFVKIGLVPDSGGTYFLPRLVGSARATALMMLGEKLGAAEAVAVGMIYKTCGAEALEEVAGGLAHHLATQPTRALALIKRAVHAASDNDLPTQLELEAAYQGLAGTTADYAEGVAAFLAKRPARFRGV